MMPLMAECKAEISIDKSPDDVWKLVRQFGDLADYMPGIDKCVLDGDVRTLETMGISIKEQLRSADDATRTLTYSIIESPMNLESHEATIAITPEGSGSHVTWTCEVRPDSAAPILQGAYDGGVAGIKKAVEG
jgi:carbon monoxide dehydrogenase subunit G